MRKENKFISKDGKTNIHYYIWYPENEVKAVIQLNHGVTEYMDNYNEFAEFLCSNDFLVIGHDQIGHGHSAETIDKLGKFSKEDSADILIDDMHTVMEKAKAEYPNVPYFLIGHSFGSFQSRIFAATYGDKLNGLVLTGTGNTKAKRVNRILKIIDHLRRIKKSDYKSKLVLAIIFGPYSARIKHPRNFHEWMCRDEKSVSDYLRNPLNNYIYTLNGFSTLLKVSLKMQEEEVYESTPKNLPILMLSGSEDPVGHYGGDIHEVGDKYKEHNVKDISVKIYEGARHNVLYETNKQEVMQDCLKWILKNNSKYLDVNKKKV